MATATPDLVTVEFDPTAINRQTDIIFAATGASGGSAGTAGVMSAEQATQLALLVALAAGGFGPKIFTNLTRPAPNDAQFADILADGRVAVIWNSTDKKVNYSDGVNWYNADGAVT